MRLFTHRLFGLHSEPDHSRSHSGSQSLNWHAYVKPNTRRRWILFGRSRRTSAKEDGDDSYIRDIGPVLQDIRTHKPYNAWVGLMDSEGRCSITTSCGVDYPSSYGAAASTSTFSNIISPRYSVDVDVAKENQAHYRLTGLPRLNTVLAPQDFPDYLFVHYAAISPKPVLYIRVLPSPAASDADARCQNVAHLHITDDPRVSPHRPLAPTRLAAFTFYPTVGEYRAECRERVMAMVSPPVCCAHDALREVARMRYEELSKRHAEGKGFELEDPKFYGLYIPFGCLERELHVGCNPHNFSGCREGTPILLSEDPFEDFVGA